GKLADHNKVSLYSLLPDGSQPAAASKSSPHQLGQAPGNVPAYYTRLVKEDGEWTMKQTAQESQENNPLEALNPLRQLEELEKMEKKVTEEAGSARGTRVLRIELTTDEARRQLSAELERQMQAIRPSAQGSSGTAGKPATALAAQRALWEQKEAELQQRLMQASIKTVYYLKVDSKRNLPKRLTWNRTMTYPGNAGYSVNVQPGENVLVEMIGSERDLIKAVVEEVGKAGGRAFVQLTDRTVLRSMLKYATPEGLQAWAEIDLNRMKQMDCYIGIRAGENVNDLADVPEENMKLYNSLYSHPVHSEQRVKHTKWVVLRYPNASMAQLANTTTEAFEDFYFEVCNLDYAKMDKAQDALADLMRKTDK
ncbi:hypothetical protein KC345_g11602, partial [Hortaea werneckii]